MSKRQCCFCPTCSLYIMNMDDTFTEGENSVVGTEGEDDESLTSVTLIYPILWSWC